MNWLTRSRQQGLGLLIAAILVLSLALSACGSPTNATNNGSTHNSVNTQSQQYQPSDSQNSGSGSAAGNTDQQIQNLLRQLDGAQNNVNNADAGATQDGRQP